MISKTAKLQKRTLIVFALLLLFVNSASAETEMADFMRSNGKIYVVIAVLATIFAVIIGYLVYLDHKISKLEKK